MSEQPSKARDYSETLFLPKTDFPMRAGLPKKEPEILERWKSLDLYGRLRAASKGRPRFVLHDGPPYANGNIHIGHALNKILKDVVTRSQQMLGFDSNYVPGWDCHGLPIEWKIEEENYRAKGKPKPDLSNPAALVEFRQECRPSPQHWIDVQREEFERLGVVGDWAHPYTTMDPFAEAQIAREIMKFAANGTLYRGSKPVMWSVVEKTALAEAEVEYEDYTSDTVWVKFPIVQVDIDLHEQASEELAMPLRRLRTNSAEAHRRRLDDYALDDPWQPRDQFSPNIRIRALRSGRCACRQLGKAGRPCLSWPTSWRSTSLGKRELLLSNNSIDSVSMRAGHSFLSSAAIRSGALREATNFKVPLLAGDHVTDDTGTGFVHTAPGHGREDFDVWIANFDRIQRIVAPKDTPDRCID